tara:strand:+ start:216 stop:422 length:207 start_codon:yes stop_codon:yes gene_type:complete
MTPGENKDQIREVVMTSCFIRAISKAKVHASMARQELYFLLNHLNQVVPKEGLTRLKKVRIFVIRRKG